MKRKLTITIDIDTNRDQRPNSEAYANFKLSSATHEIRDDSLKVFVGAGSLASDPYALASLIAHELGHLVANVCGLPAAKNDPIITHNFDNEGPKTVACEVEAWNLAALIFRAIRSRGLDSYEREYGIKATNLEEV